MRVCPVCNETFPEEMKFCDLDGAKLHRDGESIAQSQGKLWSLLGVGVVLGSLVIIGLAIFFSPRTPAPISSYTPPTPQSSESKSSATDATGSSQPEVFEEEAPVAELKKKEKPLDSTNSNTSTSPLNPKAAAEESEKSDALPLPTDVKEAAQPEAKKIEPVESPKTVKVSDSNESSKASQPSVEAKKETKSKDSDKASDDKKQNDDKKKGGFLKVFRKIFGGKKDEKEKKN